VSRTEKPYFESLHANYDVTSPNDLPKEDESQTQPEVYERPAYSGLTKVYNESDPSQPEFPSDYEVIKKVVLHVRKHMYF